MKTARFRAGLLLVALVAAGGFGCSRRSQVPAKRNAQLLQAVEKGDTSTVQRLLREGAYLGARNLGGETALALAAACGHSDTVQLLLDKGASPVAGGMNG